jgi:hypothetical protein
LAGVVEKMDEKDIVFVYSVKNSAFSVVKRPQWSQGKYKHREHSDIPDEFDNSI